VAPMQARQAGLRQAPQLEPQLEPAPLQRELRELMATPAQQAVPCRTGLIQVHRARRWAPRRLRIPFPTARMRSRELPTRIVARRQQIPTRRRPAAPPAVRTVPATRLRRDRRRRNNYQRFLSAAPAPGQIGRRRQGRQHRAGKEIAGVPGGEAHLPGGSEDAMERTSACSSLAASRQSAAVVLQIATHSSI
jgi:hypothetical protein